MASYALPNSFVDPNVIASFGTPPAAATQSFSQANGFGYGNPMGMPVMGNDIYGFGGASTPGEPPTTPPPASGGFMNLLRGQAGVAGDGVTGWLGNSQNLSAVFQGIGALTQAYLGFQQLRQAKEGLKFQKQAYKANLANSEQSYNTSLEDRIRGRTSNYAGKEEDVQSYLSANRLRQSGT